MGRFTPAEVEYLQSRRLGPLATATAAGEPHVVPVAFVYNEEQDTIDIGGRGMGGSKKYRDVAQNPHAAFVVDDAPEPGRIRFLEIRGRAEQVATGGAALRPGFNPQFIRITPRRITSWGVNDDAQALAGRSVE